MILMATAGSFLFKAVNNRDRPRVSTRLALDVKAPQSAAALVERPRQHKHFTPTAAVPSHGGRSSATPGSQELAPPGPRSMLHAPCSPVFFFFTFQFFL